MLYEVITDNQDAVQETGRIAASKEFHLDTPALKMDFHVKGMDNADWGMKDRLSRIFSPKSGNALILAFDHGYIMGAATGLERLDILIPSLADDIDVFMATRGAVITSYSIHYTKLYDQGRNKNIQTFKACGSAHYIPMVKCKD